MKKLLMIAAILAFSTSAFAAATVNTPAGSTLKLEDTAAATAHPLEIAASPKVNMSYANPDTTNFQYFIIGTYHEGGTNLYASSSSITKIYHYTFKATDTKGFSKMPTTQAQAQSEPNWSDAGFTD